MEHVSISHNECVVVVVNVMQAFTAPSGQLLSHPLRLVHQLLKIEALITIGEFL